MPRRTTTAAAIAAATATALLTACGGGSSTKNAGPSTGPPSAMPGHMMSMSPGAHMATIPVTATEMKFSLTTRTGKPGTYTFVMTNAGTTQHALAIKGPGIGTKTSDIVGSGGKARLTADLQRGTYELWCPVGQHRQLGMETTFTIQ